LAPFRAVLPERVFKNTFWNECTSLGAGSSPVTLLQPQNENELLLCVELARRNNIKLFVLGGGFNIAGTDEVPERTAFLRLPKEGAFSELEFIEKNDSFSLVRCGSANTLRSLLFFALKDGYGGASGLSGIPGTLGGAVAMNAGANGVCVSEFIDSVKVLPLCPGGEITVLPGKEIAFAYRSAPDIRDNMVILEAVLRFPKVDREKEEELFAIEAQRRSMAPAGRSAGSVFRNPRKGPPAGKLLDDCNCKNWEEGAFMVSPSHANWIIRKKDYNGPALEKDLRTLVHRLQKAAAEKFDTALVPEIRFVRHAGMDAEAHHAVKVLVVMGGTSSERDVSLESGRAVANALREASYNVREYDIKDFVLTDEMTDWADVVFPVLHGGEGEGGGIQKMFEDAGIRFTASGSTACRIIMDKVISKKIMDKAGIPNAKSVVVTSKEAPMPEELKLPLIVKPAAEGSTFGIAVVHNAGEWKGAMDLVFQYGKVALVEEFFKGVETTVGVLDGQALPVIEIRFESEIYDYDAKYEHKFSNTQYLCPPQNIPEDMQAKLREAALNFYRATGARDILRVDIIADVENGTLCVLEGNTIPGCTANSLVPKAAKKAGISFPELCSRLVCAALSR
ncbi:MAG: D-alanine--D-alanine ligase, partial [Lentisphaeria bacterium]|nr:D-alanine--D-alanine ligase [Lentisphaeria bacterium]